MSMSEKLGGIVDCCIGTREGVSVVVDGGEDIEKSKASTRVSLRNVHAWVREHRPELLR